MNLLEFTIDFDLLTTNSVSLSDTFRLALYQENEKLFELLSYEDDYSFLEPTLICYFLSDLEKFDKTSLNQIIFGYTSKENRPQSIFLKADRFGIVNLPNLGYIKSYPNSLIEYNILDIDENIIFNQFIKNSTIRLCLHTTDLLGYSDSIIFHEGVEQTLSKNIKSLESAVFFFQNYLKEFWEVIDNVTREFIVFSSPNHNSFAGISQHGTAYFNTENRLVSPIFFIDDIAHQCGHIIFNVLTLQTANFLKVPKNTLLRDFINEIDENREVYTVFHALYTYTAIVASLSKALDVKGIFDDELVVEIKARLGFYMQKFDTDLKNIKNAKVLTDLGMKYYDSFYEVYRSVKNSHDSIFNYFTYNNQPYIFDFVIFKRENKVKLTYI